MPGLRLDVHSDGLAVGRRVVRVRVGMTEPGLSPGLALERRLFPLLLHGLDVLAPRAAKPTGVRVATRTAVPQVNIRGISIRIRDRMVRPRRRRRLNRPRPLKAATLWRRRPLLSLHVRATSTGTNASTSTFIPVVDTPLDVGHQPQNERPLPHTLHLPEHGRVPRPVCQRHPPHARPLSLHPRTNPRDTLPLPQIPLAGLVPNLERLLAARETDRLCVIPRNAPLGTRHPPVLPSPGTVRPNHKLSLSNSPTPRCKPRRGCLSILILEFGRCVRPSFVEPQQHQLVRQRRHTD